MNWETVGPQRMEALGTKAVYTLRSATGFVGCVLTAVGWDGLPLLALPPFGKHFARPNEAKDYAERLERVKTVEPLGGVG